MAKKKYDRGNRREKEPKEFDEEVLEIARVTRVVKGGRRLRFRALVAIGDRKGRVGVGVGKATEVVSAIKKAVTRAKRDMLHVPITNKDSIPHQVKVKHKAARMLIMPASPGTGVIAGGSLRKILSLAGVKNVLSKNYGTNNKLVTAQASIKALHMLKPVRKGAKKVEEKVEATASEKGDSMKEEKAEKKADKIPASTNTTVSEKKDQEKSE